jgi:hypothetical protein
MLSPIKTINAWGSERRVHHLKTLPIYFEDILDGRKSFELQKNDRDYKVGEFLCLWECKDGTYSDRAVLAAVPYILGGAPELGLKEGVVAMTIRIMANRIVRT